MRVHICAVGRLRAGPEHELVDDYLGRFDRTGRALGLGPVSMTEVENKKGGGKKSETVMLEKSIPKNSLICVLDERGEVMSSTDFARQLARWRDDGQQDVAFVLGGADGIDRAMRARANASLSLGQMVWPHMLARVMLAEQLYRAATILAGGPYHRS